VADTSCYVYALKDPRVSPARPFYIGRGTGARAWDHVLVPDRTLKGQRVQEILDTGHNVIVAIMSDALTEIQACKLEAELISAYGTIATGGFLTNSVIPTGKPPKVRKTLVIPSGAQEKAQLGLNLLKEAILELARCNKDGISNAEVSRALGLQSDYRGGSKDYLAFSLLGLLLREGRLERRDSPARGRYFAQAR
jgi:uncharacterized protein